MLIYIAVIIAAVVDTQISKISVYSRLSSGIEIIIFTIIILVVIIGQYMMLKYISRKNDETFVNIPLLKKTHRVVTALYYVLGALLVATTLEMITTTAYNIYLLESVLWLSYGLSIILMSFLSLRFFSWFRSNRNPVILAYALALASLSVAATITPLFISSDLENVPISIIPMRSTGMAFGSAGNIYSGSYVIISTLSFVITWFATALLLRHYAKKVGKARFWIVVVLPLIYFISQFNQLFVDLFFDIRLSNPILFNILYTILFGATKPVGGLLFGLAFWKIAQAIKQTKIKDYMVISGCGIMLLFITNQPSVLNAAPYPPFAMASTAMVGIASYLLLVGIYTAAISISQDVLLRRTIKNYIKSDADLLRSIAASEVQRIVEKKVSSAMKMHPPEKEVIPPTLEDQEVKEYIRQVMDEVKKERSKS